MTVVKSCSRQISINSFIAVIAALIVGLFVGAAYADPVIYTNGDTIPETIIGDVVNGDLEIYANTDNIHYYGTINDVSSTIPTNLFATGSKQVWIRGNNLFTGVSTSECNALAFKGNASNTIITSAGFAGSQKIAFESKDASSNRNMTLYLTAAPSTPQPHTGIFQINASSRLYFATDANLGNSTLKLNSRSSDGTYTEVAFNASAKKITFKDVTCENKYVRVLNINDSIIPDDLNTISFQSGTFSGEMGRMGNGGGDLPGKTTSYVNYFNLTKASDGTDDGGTLTLSGPVYHRGETTIEGGTLVISGSDFVTSSALTGSGTLKLSGNNKYFNILSDSQSEFTGTIQLFDDSITGNGRIRLAAATYSWSNNALQTEYSATDVSLPKATLVLNGNTSGKYSELAFQSKNSSFTIGTLQDNGYGRILNLDSSTTLTELEDFCTLTVGNGTFAGEIGRRENENLYPYTNHINLVKANDGTADGGTLTLSNKYMDFYGSTTIEGGTLEITNSLSDNNYQFYSRSTALKGSGNLNFTGSNWTVFSINTDDTEPQEFSGTVNVADSTKIMIKNEANEVKDLNLGNAALNLGKNAIVGLHVNSGNISTLTVKELYTDTGSTIRLCSTSPGEGNFGTLTVGSGTVNGNLGVNDTGYFSWGSLVKVSDGSEDGGTLTINGNYYYTGPTTISAGTLKIVNNAYSNKNFNTSKALAGEGTLDIETLGISGNSQSWIFFSTGNAQDFTGLVNLTGAVVFDKDTNLENATLHVSENTKATLHTDSAKNLTVKVLNTDSGSTIRYSHTPASSANLPYATLTVGSGTVNGNLGETNNANTWYNWVNLVKVSDGSDDGGTLTVSGQNLYAGSIDIQAGTLKLTGDATLSKGATTIGEDAKLVFSYNADKSITVSAANPISGAGKIVKSGSGTLRLDNLDAPTTISADLFTVNAGELDFRGDFEGDIEIINGAVFSPGNSIGTLSVTGNVSVLDGIALFEFEQYTG
ncbi:MAG: autotransporter-associated beta strand repeat-containing protein, partial [Thermoguttaceae bacterium]|nr:autotransporter-associated beta strand repeat-containing protein [Thermoguttaceae bacterium]